MKSPDESGRPTNIIRWAIVGCVIWVISGLTLIFTTNSSLRRPLDLGGKLTERMIATEDQARQQQFNVLLLRAFDNRLAAVKALQRRVIIFAGGTVASGILTAWFLVRVYRSLRHEVTYQIVYADDSSDSDAPKYPLQPRPPGPPTSRNPHPSLTRAAWPSLGAVRNS